MYKVRIGIRRKLHLQAVVCLFNFEIIKFGLQKDNPTNIAVQMY